MSLKKEYSILQREAVSIVAKRIFGRAISFEEQEKLIDAVENPMIILDGR